ncbi:MAG TPA: DNA repair protein RecO [Sphingomonas sp.]|nr:DNA repair protein RecO [Sphingomonas sp.]
MHIRAQAIILAVRAHGEHGAIVRALTAADGVLAGYVRGGRSRQLRPILQPANVVLGEWRARTEDQLAQLAVELVHSRAPLFAEPLPAAALDWVTALTAATLPEGQPYPAIHAALAGVLDAIEAAPAARGWAAALVRYELLLLAELGFGLALDRCVVTGAADDLAWVSPKSGAAVGRAAGGDYADRLLPLPAFVRDGGAADWPDILAGLRLTGHFLERDLFADRRAETLAARARLIDRLKRAVA